MNFFLPLLLLLCSTSLFSQLHDNMWLFNQVDSNSSQIDFREDPPNITTGEKIRMSFTNASFCDKEGNLLYYSNGMQINNRLDELMENGDSLNAEFIEHSSYSYIPVSNGAFFLPKPVDSTQCYLIYASPELFTEPLFAISSTAIRYALIDMAANNGLGKVIEKETALIAGDFQLHFNHAGAVRHANGRDWWILIPHNMKPQYFRILLSPEGFSEPVMQEIGFKEPTDDPNYYLGPNLFSRDGIKYADYDFRTGVQIFDFDRCTGLLSNPIKIDYTWDQSASNGGSGIAFSPSGKVLYMTYIENGKILVAQYNLDTPDIPSSKIIISECPPSSNAYVCSFGKLALGLNNKIYAAALIDTTSFHVIHEPDSIGLASEFEFGGFEFPMIYPRGTFPYFPNYRLYDVPESQCDTLGIDAPVIATHINTHQQHMDITTYPNPANHELHLQYNLADNQPLKFQLSNATGQPIRKWEVPSGQQEQALSLQGIPPGIYFWQMSRNGNTVGNGKLVIEKR